MARKIVTLQTRRGNSADFDESKMLAGEIATAEDTEQAYISFADGTAEELALKRDIEAGNGNGNGGTTDHAQLVNRDAANQHPISSVTGLQATLDELKIIGVAAGDSIVLTDASDSRLYGLTLYGKTTQNGTPSPTNPIPLVSAGGIGSIHTSIIGKNLLPYPYPFVTYTTNGVTATVNNDGSVKLSGVATANTYIYLTQYSVANDTGFNAPTGTVYVSGCPAGGSVNSYRIQVSAYKNGVYAAGASDIGNGASFQNEEGTVCACYIHVIAGTNVDGLTFRPMISMEQGAAFTQTITQILAAQTPNGLNGVPVTSGGNYTDENGQQWICDEIDFSRGVYLQNTRRFTINGSAAQSISSITVRQNTVRFWVYGANPGGGGGALAAKNTTALCDKLPYSEKVGSDENAIGIRSGAYAGYPSSFILSLPIAAGTTAAAISAYLAANSLDVVYALAEPIETPLTAAEIAAYKALHTNKQNTTIMNDGGAGISVSYVPDNQSANGLNDILNNGGIGGPGVGIASVEQTTTSAESGGVNVVTITKTDGVSSSFEVRNGAQGPEGPQGNTGPSGIYIRNPETETIEQATANAEAQGATVIVDPSDEPGDEFLITAAGVAQAVDDVSIKQANLFHSVGVSSISQQTYQQVNFSEQLNYGSYAVGVASNTDAHIAINKPGFYLLEGQVRYTHTAAPTAAVGYLYRNGSENLKNAIGSVYGTNYAGYASITTIAKLEAGDKITLLYRFVGSGKGTIVSHELLSESHLKATYLGGV